jgi:mono/diheme cytochrome c family protein
MGGKVEMKFFNIAPIIIFLIISCSRKNTEKGFEIFPDMVHSVAYEAYSENEVTRDGKTMQLPPVNTIARGKMPFPYGKGKEEAIRAGLELSTPYRETQKTLNRGRETYGNYCQLCHGVTGKGDGPMIPKFPNPPSFTSRRLKTYSPGRLYHIITLGSGDMPSHGEQISRKDRWHLVQYIKYMQKEF